MSNILSTPDLSCYSEHIKIKTIDAHTGGEPLRIIYAGFPEPEGDTILAKRRYTKQNHDDLRKALMWEPRGHADMYGCIITAPVREGSDFGVLFTHNEGFSTMCGHGIIAVTTVVFDSKMIEKSGDDPIIKIDSPAGLITAQAHIRNSKVESVSFENVPSYVDEFDATVEVPDLGTVRYDLAFGGAYYAYVNAKDVNVGLTPEYHDELVAKGKAIKKAVMDSRKIIHPEDEDMGFLYGVIFVGEPEDKNNHSRNVCMFAEGEIDRSPTGTGVAGRCAIHYGRKEVGLNDPIVIESIVGSSFKVEALKEVQFGPHQAIIARVNGRAHISGHHEFIIDADDPLKDGFCFR